MKPSPCPTPIEPYSGEPVTTTCHRIPETGAPQEASSFLVLGFVVVLVGCALVWFVRVKR